MLCQAQPNLRPDVSERSEVMECWLSNRMHAHCSSPRSEILPSSSPSYERRTLLRAKGSGLLLHEALSRQTPLGPS